MGEAEQKRPVALVTGASGGIGEALAYEIARDGYDLFLVARSREGLERVAKAARAQCGVEAATLPLDLARPGAGDELAQTLDARGISPELVVNNAGFGLLGHAGALSRDEQIEMVDLNVRTLVDLSLRFLPAMRARGRGGIINVASVAGFMPGPFMAVYYATKAFVISFTEALARELAGTGVTVTALCPGVTATGFQARAGMSGHTVERLGRAMSAEEVARLGYGGFKAGRRVAVTGLANRLFALAPRFVPRALLLGVIARLQR